MKREHPLVTMVRLLGLTAMAVSAFAYPLQFDDELAKALYFKTQAMWGGAALFANLEPIVRFGFGPLPLKETLTSWVLLLLFACWIAWRLTVSDRPSRWRIETGALVAFLLWGLVSALRAPHFAYDSECLYTAFDFTLWILVFIALSDLPASQRFARTWTRWVLFIGLVLMLISLAESFESTSRYVFRVLLKNDVDRYQRNLYGSLIGHNTGVASMGMGPFFFALGAFFAARRRWVKVGLGLYVLISLWFFQVTKSRAVWLLILSLTPLFVLGLRPVLGVPVRLRHFLAGIAILLLMVLGLVFATRVGLMQGSLSDYMARLRSFTPAVLVQGTRARVLRVGYELIRQRPLAGHGLGAFTAIYPQAQAAFFETHPNSSLRPTDLLTLEAHNDYLQLLIETGAIGIGLAVLTFAFHFRRGWGRWRGERLREERLRRYCALFALGATALHALVDFPFHLAPLATFFAFYAAIALGSPDEDESVFIPQPAAPPSKIIRGSTDLAEVNRQSPPASSLRPPASGEFFRPVLRGRKVAALSAVLVAWGVIIPASAFVGRRLLADTHASKANGNLEYAMGIEDTRTRRAALDAAFAKFRDSLRVDPLQYLTRIQMGQCRLRFAAIFARDSADAAQKGDRARAELDRKTALTYLENAIRDLQTTSFMIDAGPGQAARVFRLVARPFRPWFMGEAPMPQDTWANRPLEAVGPRVNRVLSYALARCWVLYGELEPARTDATENAFRAYRTTIAQAPTGFDYLVETLDYMNAKRLDDKAYRHRLYGLMTRYEPARFVEYVIRRATDYAEVQDHAGAARWLEDLQEAVGPEKRFPDVLRALSLAYIMAGEKEKYHRTVLGMAEDYGDCADLPYLLLMDKVWRGEYREADQTLSEMERRDADLMERWQLLHAQVLRALGREKEAEEMERRIVRESALPSVAWFYRAEFKRFLFDDLAGSLDDYDRAIRCFPPAMSPSAYFVLLRGYSERGEWDAYDRVLDLARLRIPDNPRLEKIEKEAAARRARDATR